MAGALYLRKGETVTAGVTNSLFFLQSVLLSSVPGVQNTLRAICSTAAAAPNPLHRAISEPPNGTRKERQRGRMSDSQQWFLSLIFLEMIWNEEHIWKQSDWRCIFLTGSATMWFSDKISPSYFWMTCCSRMSICWNLLFGQYPGDTEMASSPRLGKQANIMM